MDHIEGFLGGVIGKVKANFLFKEKIFIFFKEIYGDLLKENDFHYEDGIISFYVKPIIKQEIKYKEEELRNRFKEEFKIDLVSIKYYSPRQKPYQ